MNPEGRLTRCGQKQRPACLLPDSTLGVPGGGAHRRGVRVTVTGSGRAKGRNVRSACKRAKPETAHSTVNKGQMSPMQRLALYAGNCCTIHSCIRATK
eukprot:351515-Chlamydomonas_euryale.AAC.6